MSIPPGHLSATMAYILWGILPLYWRLLDHIAPLSILAYRIGLSFVTSWIVLLVIFCWRKTAFSGLRNSLPRSLLAAGLIGTNWYVFIWGVVKGFTLEVSLGYFLSPLVNVLLGLIFFKEKPGKMKSVALALSGVAVFIFTISLGRLPLISLVLATSFGLYGYVKKQTSINPTLGLGLESFWLLIPAIYILGTQGGISPFVNSSSAQQVLLILAGPFTLVPLLLFASAAKKIPLYVLGFFQYFTPSIIFIIAWLVFKEQAGSLELLAFSIIWIALIIFSLAVLVERRDNSKQNISLSWKA